MLRAIRHLQRDLASGKWDTDDDPPSFIVHLRAQPDGTVTGFHQPLASQSVFIALQRISLGSPLALYAQPFYPCPGCDFIVALIPAPESRHTCMVKVWMGATGYTAANEEWTLRVSPDAKYVPVYRGITLLPWRAFIKTRMELIEGDHLPHALFANASHEATMQLCVYSPFETLRVETLPDLRYGGPLNFGRLIGKELAENVWHPDRVCKLGLTDLDS